MDGEEHGEEHKPHDTEEKDDIHEELKEIEQQDAKQQIANKEAPTIQLQRIEEEPLPVHQDNAPDATAWMDNTPPPVENTGVH